MKTNNDNAKNIVCLVMAIFMLCGSSAYSRPGSTAAAGQLGADGKWHEPPQAREQRTQWWREARFGMFIHWGLYAIPAGKWKGKEYKGYSEWIMHKAKIPVKEYEKLAARFNPVKFDARQWVKLAKNTGMKYMVITAKHHDGFAMFGSKVNPYNIVDATPFERDPIKELSQACRKAGIKFGCYYSVDRDWHHPDAFCGNQGEGNTWDFPNTTRKDFDKYLNEKALPQLKELLTGYGPLGIMWFDGVGTKTPQQNEQIIAMIRTLQPQCLINSRLGDWKKYIWGDYRSMDDDEVADKLLPYGWENPGTINRTYGYSEVSQRWRSHTDIIRMLADIASKGGNYLLNIGPKPDGTIPPRTVRILQEVGKWMDKYGESIYGTTGSRIGRFPWGRCTTKPGKYYLHVFDWPSGDEIALPKIDVSIKKAYLLADPAKKPLKCRSTGDGNVIIELDTISMPPEALDASDTVIVLDVAPMRE